MASLANVIEASIQSWPGTSQWRSRTKRRLDTLEVFAVGVAGNHLATIIVAEAHIATSSLESAAMIIYRECIMPILKLAGVLVPTYEAALKQHLMHGRIYLAYGLHAVPN